MRGIAVCWPDSSPRLRAIAARGRVPLYCQPRHATIPGSPVAVVSPQGEVKVLFTLQRVDGPTTVTLADGSNGSGYELVARRGTVRRATQGSLGKMLFQWRALGQLRYFDPKTMRPVIFGAPRPGGVFVPSSPADESEMIRFRSFAGGVPGRPLSHPESRLVARYVKWVGGASRFRHAQALSTGGYTDLFNLTTWTLFEAKASSDHRKVREAFGQLHDYRRAFSRSPRLAVLVPSRPGRRVIEFLDHFSVAAVWERRSGSFVDSVGGRLSATLRAWYQERI
jgi:hypothetical protein